MGRNTCGKMSYTNNQTPFYMYTILHVLVNFFLINFLFLNYTRHSGLCFFHVYNIVSRHLQNLNDHPKNYSFVLYFILQSQRSKDESMKSIGGRLRSLGRSLGLHKRQNGETDKSERFQDVLPVLWHWQGLSCALVPVVVPSRP